MQVFESQAQLIRKTTDAMVNEINNNATIIAQAAYSQADLIAKNSQVNPSLVNSNTCMGCREAFYMLHQQPQLMHARIIWPHQCCTNDMSMVHAHAGSQAVALATVSGARNSGLELLYGALNVSSPAQKARLDFVQSLINNGNASLHVGYQTKLLTS